MAFHVGEDQLALNEYCDAAWRLWFTENDKNIVSKKINCLERMVEEFDSEFDSKRDLKHPK